MITFPEQDTFPLSTSLADKMTGTIISEHFDLVHEGAKAELDEELRMKTCPYNGCPDLYNMRPPCGLCYE